MLSANGYVRRRLYDAPGAEASTNRLTGRPHLDVAALRELLRTMHGHLRRGQRRESVPSGWPGLDAALPLGGLPVGAVTEILYEGEGIGATSLAVRVARQAAGSWEYAVFVQSPGGPDDLYPPALVQAGLRIGQMVMVQPASPREAIWACDQSLRCPEVAVVVIRHGGLRHIDERVSRLFQLAAEQGGGVGLVLRPAAEMAGPQVGRPEAGRRFKGSRTFAAVQLLVERVAMNSPRQGAALCRIRILKTREGMPVEPVVVDLNDEAGHVPMYAPAADRAVGTSERLATA